MAFNHSLELYVHLMFKQGLRGNLIERMNEKETFVEKYLIDYKISNMGSLRYTVVYQS